MPPPEPAAGERLDLLLSERRIRRRIASLACQIDRDYAGRTAALVVVLKGAAIFAADLARRIATPLTLDFVTAASYGADTRSSGRVELAGIDGLDIAGRHVLVVEDILDSGLTITAVLAALRQRGPASLGISTLLRKPAARALDLPIPYVGFDIEDDFVVGCGLDYAGRYRNLPGIYRLSLETAG